MEYYTYNSGGELTHWGIKGMRWGVRRYQNKDGSLTAAGKKRRAKLEGELEKLDGGKKSGSSSNSSSEPAKKSVSEMSTAELRAATERMNAEKNYYDAQKNLASSIPPKQVSKGRKFAEKFLSESVLPAISNTAKSYLESYLKKTLGIDTKDELATLKKKFDTLDYKQRIDKIEHPEKYKTADERTKEYDLQVKKEKAAADYKSLEDTKKELEQTRKELEEERKKNRTEQGGA